ncbi:amidohydrolase family protein [Saccharothrix sp. 6-C]|nr:amidohydrolase family protein [Saccharothrix sp. 6-C]
MAGQQVAGDGVRSELRPLSAVPFLSGLTGPTSVLIRDRRIHAVGRETRPQPSPDAVVIDGGGRVLMPGLTDAHVHLFATGTSLAGLTTGATGAGYYTAPASAEQMLMRGFTTVRDMAGDVASLRQVLNAGNVPRPSHLPSQAAISQTSGHGDFSHVFEDVNTFSCGPIEHGHLVAGPHPALPGERPRVPPMRRRREEQAGLRRRRELLHVGAGARRAHRLRHRPADRVGEARVVGRDAHPDVHRVRLHARRGVEGAWADVLLVEDDPTQDLTVLGDPDKNFAGIIKDGRVHKNILCRPSPRTGGGLICGLRRRPRRAWGGGSPGGACVRDLLPSWMTGVPFTRTCRKRGAGTGAPGPARCRHDSGSCGAR